MYIFGIIVLIVGICSKVYFKKKAFERRNSAGVEEHSGYWSMLMVRALESSSTFIIIIGIALVIIGELQQ